MSSVVRRVFAAISEILFEVPILAVTIIVVEDRGAQRLGAALAGRTSGAALSVAARMAFEQIVVVAHHFVRNLHLILNSCVFYCFTIANE